LQSICCNLLFTLLQLGGRGRGRGRGRGKTNQPVKAKAVELSIQEQEVAAGNELLLNLNIDFYLLQIFLIDFMHCN
jgi:hypothetical protein